MHLICFQGLFWSEEMNLEKLTKTIGKKYQETDENGNYIGCFEPMYMLYPDIPRFQFLQNVDYFSHSLEKIKETLKEIRKEEIKEGDIIVFKMPRKVLHIAVYIGNGKIIQTFKNSSMQINKVNLDSKRIIGVYRWDF